MRLSSKTRSLPLIAFAIAAALFLLLSYQYSQSMLSRINSIAVDNVQSNAQVQVTDASALLAAKLTGIASSLTVVSDTASRGEGSQTKAALVAAQAASNNFTAYYFWMGSNGTLLAVNGTGPTAVSYAGVNFSQKSYFVDAEQTRIASFTGAVPSLSGNGLQIFITIGIFNSSAGIGLKSFEGIAGAAIDLTSLGAYLDDEIAPVADGQVGLLDASGGILYSSTNSSSSLLGQSVFSQQVQDAMPSAVEIRFNTQISYSIRGNETFFASTFPVGATTVTLANEAVIIPGMKSTSGTDEFGVFYVMLPDVLEGSNANVIAQLRVLSSFIIIGITGLAVCVAILFLESNRRLDQTVRERTSDLVAANEQLKAYAQSQTDFVNIAAHELRTPTQSILGFTEILEDANKPSIDGRPSPAGGLSDPEVRAAVSSISNNARRLKKLTDDILSVSRLDANRMLLSKEHFDLNAVIRSVVDEVQEGIRSGKNRETLKTVFQPADPSLEVYADNSKIREVLLNLLANAVRFSEGNGTIVVTSRRMADGQALVSVRDQGKGIDPEILPRLFNKFVTTSPSGTGLGLFIASKLVAAHGGKMWAENNGAGTPGSTFSFTIPTEEGGKRTAES